MEAKESRLATLERRVRLLSIALFVVIGLAAAGVILGAAGANVVRADKIVFDKTLIFETTGGQKLADLQLRRHGPALWFYDNTGRQVLNLGASANDFGGYIIIAGKPGEGTSTHLSGRGFFLMGKRAGGGKGPWMSLYRHKGIFSGLEIRGQGASMIKLVTRGGAPRVEVIDRDGEQVWCTP